MNRVHACMVVMQLQCSPQAQVKARWCCDKCYKICSFPKRCTLHRLPLMVVCVLRFALFYINGLALFYINGVVCLETCSSTLLIFCRFKTVHQSVEWRSSWSRFPWWRAFSQHIHCGSHNFVSMHYTWRSLMWLCSLPHTISLRNFLLWSLRGAYYFLPW